LLDVTDHFGRFGALGEIDVVRLLDDGRDAIFDESEVGQVDAYSSSARNKSVSLRIHTEEWDARRVGRAQRLPILAKVFRTAHEPAHVFEDGGCPRVDLMPGPVQAMYRRRSERRDDGGEGREII